MLNYIFNSGLYPESWIPPILAAVILGVWHYRRARKEHRSRERSNDEGGK